MDKQDEEQEYLAMESASAEAIAENEYRIEAEHEQELNNQDELLTDEEIRKATEWCYKVDEEEGGDFMDFITHAVAKAQLSKVLKHKLDSPELRKKLYHILPTYARKVDEIAELGLIHSETRARWGVLLEETLDQILALIPDIKHAMVRCPNCGAEYVITYDNMVKEARKQERERIINQLQGIYNQAGDLRVMERQLRELLYELRLCKKGEEK